MDIQTCFHKLMPLLLILLLSGSACAADQEADNESAQTVTLQEALSIGQISLPASAGDIAYYAQVGMDNYVAMRFTVDEADLQPFFQSAGYATPLETATLDNYPGMGQPGNEHWIAGWPDGDTWLELINSDGQSFLVGNGDQPGFARRAIVDLRNTDRPTVYLIHSDL